MSFVFTLVAGPHPTVPYVDYYHPPLSHMVVEDHLNDEAPYSLAMDVEEQHLQMLVNVPNGRMLMWALDDLLAMGCVARLSDGSAADRRRVLDTIADRLTDDRCWEDRDLMQPEVNGATPIVLQGDPNEDLYPRLCTTLDIEVCPSDDVEAQRRCIEHIENVHGRPVLLIPEAQDLGLSGLIDLQHLQQVGDLTLVLAGDERLNGLLDAPEVASLRKEISVDLTIAPAINDEREVASSSRAKREANSVLTTMDELLLADAPPEHMRSQLTVTLDRDEKALVDAVCERRGISTAHFLRAAIGTVLKIAAAAPLPPTK